MQWGVYVLLMGFGFGIVLFGILRKGNCQWGEDGASAPRYVCAIFLCGFGAIFLYCGTRGLIEVFR